MAQQVSFGRLASGGGVGGGEGPFRILLMGDFGGRGPRGLAAPLAGRKRIFLDVDNWEQVLAGLGGEVRVPVPGQAGQEIIIEPREIDDFHPDALYDKLEVFAALRSLRKRLMDNATFAAAAEEVRSWAQGGGPAGGAAEASAATPGAPAAGQQAGEPPAEMLSRLLGQRPSHVRQPTGATGAAARGGVDALIRSIVAPHIVPDTAAEQSVMAASIDRAIAAQLRAILHDNAFQALEAAWRGVHFLVTHLETDEDLQLHLMDVTREELAADLTATEDLASTALYKLLVAPTVGTQGGKPWAVLAGGFTFDRTAADAGLLGRLARIARAAGAPFVAGGRDRLAGCRSLAATPDPDDWTEPPGGDETAAWDQLRALPEAAWVALGLPRMLLRLPYGPKTDPVSRFDFDELADGAAHESYLWGNPAFALANVLGAGFRDNGWEMGAELYRDIEDVPLHIYEEDGEPRATPPAEAYLSDRAGLALQERGLTALLSVQGRDVIRIRGVAGLRRPTAALAGRWA